MIEQVHYNLENKLRMWNSPNVSKIKPLFVRPNFIP